MNNLKRIQKSQLLYINDNLAGVCVRLHERVGLDDLVERELTIDLRLQCTGRETRVCHLREVLHQQQPEQI